jgi:SAM-dependent methyltransferase
MPKTRKGSSQDRLDNKTRKILSGFLRDMSQLPNESAKRTRFAALLGQLFSGSAAVTKFPQGTEKIVRIDTASGRKRGRIDSYYGNAIIEFENSLRATGNEAERQVRDYIAGLWSAESKPHRPLVAITSDGLVWRTFLPRLNDSAKGKTTPSDVELEQGRELVVSENTLGDFWLWLVSLLFRPGSLVATAEQFRHDFSAPSEAFGYGMQGLGRAWSLVRQAPEPRLAFETWQKYLTVTYGKLPESAKEGDGGRTGKEARMSELEELFLKHTYLASVSRFLAWASLSKGKARRPLRREADEILSGEFFISRNIANLVEEDFFQWVRLPEAEEILAPIWERMLDLILTYDLSRLNQDVLKGVYQDLVDPKDRHDLGEYYTPDWLCERIVSQLLPPKGWVTVLDPACGSGSFLRAAIVHLLDGNAGNAESERLRKVLDHVAGIDIHPLAVTISRTTYVLALGPLATAAKRPIQIPVYLADSLFLPTEVIQYRLGEKPGVEIRFGGKSVTMPEDFVEAPDLFDPAVAACSKVAVGHAKTEKETISSLRAYLTQEVEGLEARADSGRIMETLWNFTDQLASLIRDKGNSIWAFIIRNGYRPAMLRKHFEFIVGNPPWLSYRYIADPEYQKEVKERAVERYAIAPKSQKLFTQMELATVFFAHALSWFGSSKARIGFVMPRSILSADQHTNLRLRQYNASFRLTEYWDLKGVHELFRVPSCVPFGRQDSDRGKASDSLPAQEWQGGLPKRDLPWEEAKAYLTWESKRAKVIYLGERNAFSTEPGRAEHNISSPYADRFHQGATLVPRNFYFVRIESLRGSPDPDKLYWAETDPEQAEDAKPPYKEIRLSGNVEGRFIYCTALSKHVLPFATLPLPTVVLPVLRQDGELSLTDSEHLRDNGFREFAAWMEKAEQLWDEKRKEKAERQSVYEWLDYQGKLRNQNSSDRHIVLYNAAGTNLSAAYLDRDSLSLPLIVDHRLYWGSFAKAEEALYVAAILNSAATNDAIKPFQSMGLMGERDIHKKVLDVPFPEFSKGNRKHEKLAELAASAQMEASKIVKKGEFPASLARRRATVREHLRDILQQIDTIVRTLI